MNFAKKQSDNVEQQEAEPSTLPSPLGLLSLLRPRSTPTELRALVADEPEDLDTEDEGLISFEEERVSGQHPPSRTPAHTAQRLRLKDLSQGTGRSLESEQTGTRVCRGVEWTWGNRGGQNPEHTGSFEDPRSEVGIKETGD